MPFARCSKVEDQPVAAAASAPPPRAVKRRFTRHELRRIDAAIVKRSKAKLAAGHVGALTLGARDFAVVSALSGVKAQRLQSKIYGRTVAMRRWAARAGPDGVAAACATRHGQRLAADAVGSQHNLPWHPSEIARLDTAVADLAPGITKGHAPPSALTYGRTAELIRNGTLGRITALVASRSVDHVLFQLQRRNGWSKAVALPPVTLETADEVLEQQRKVCVPVPEEDTWDESAERSEMQDIPGASRWCPCCIVLGPDGRVRAQRRLWLPDELERLKQGVARFARGVSGLERSDWPAIAATIRTRTIAQCKSRITWEAIQESRRIARRIARYGARCGKSEPLPAEATEGVRGLSPASTIPAITESPGREKDAAATPLALRLLPEPADKGSQNISAGEEDVPQGEVALGIDVNGQSSDVLLSGLSQIVICLRPTCPLPPVVPMSVCRAKREALRHASHEDHLRSGTSQRDRFAVREATRLAVRSASHPLFTETGV